MAAARTSLQVNVEHLVPLSFGHFCKADVPQDTRIVHQNVDTTKVLHSSSHDLVAVRHRVVVSNCDAAYQKKHVTNSPLISTPHSPTRPVLLLFCQSKASSSGTHTHTFGPDLLDHRVCSFPAKVVHHSVIINERLRQSINAETLSDLGTEPRARLGTHTVAPRSAKSSA